MSNDMTDIFVEVQALNLDGIKQNLLNYVEEQAKIDIDDSVNKADKSAKDAEDSAIAAAQSATVAADCASQASESLGLYYTKSETDVLLSAKQNSLTFDSAPTNASTNPVTSGGVYTALSGKVNTSLDNLSSAGQMIVDSQNGTISNCILEIPQNIKLEQIDISESGKIIFKSGMKLVMVDSTYSEQTLTQDTLKTYQTGFVNKEGLIFYVSDQAFLPFERIHSGATQPTVTGNTNIWFDTANKKIFITTNAGAIWIETTSSYPIAAAKTDSSGKVVEILKDSNGNDMIFNGACFIGHHAVVYPNVKGLIASGFNSNGSLNSVISKSSSLTIKELGASSTNYSIGGIQYINGHRQYYEVDYIYDVDLTKPYSFWYLRKENKTGYVSSGAFVYSGEVPYIIYSTDSNKIVTDFTIRQPVRTATVEMLDKTLGDVETLLAAI